MFLKRLLLNLSISIPLILSLILIPLRVKAVDIVPVCVFYYGAFTDAVSARFVATDPEFLVTTTPGGSYKTSRPTATDIDTLQAAGIKVLSYVSTGNLVQYMYSVESPPNDRTYVRGCIDACATEGCDGIFFDEGGVGHAPSHADITLAAPALDYYGNPNSWSGYTIQDYLDYAASKGLISVEGLDYYSPTYLDTNIFPYIDYALTDENYEGRAPSGSEVGYEAQCWVIDSGLSDAATAAGYTNDATSYGFAAGYGCNYYGALPDWYEAYIALVNTTPGPTPTTTPAPTTTATATTASSYSSSYTLYESGNMTGTSDSSPIYSANQTAQIINTTQAHSVALIDLVLKRVGDPGTVTIGIYRTDGAEIPTGTAIVSTTISQVNISLSYAKVTAVFTETTLEINTQYAIWVSAVAGDSSNYILWEQNNTVPPASSSNTTDSGISWTTGGYDCLYQVWGNPSLEIIGANVFSGYLATGDLLICMEHINTYAPYYGTTIPQQWFLIQFLSTDNSTVIASTPMT